jgi:[NiFe] hydrogenase assembly HybE family chaperone
MNPLRRSASSPLQGDHTSSPAKPVLRCVLDARVLRLVDFYRLVQTERMQGVPILNPALCVEALGFRLGEEDDAVAEGVLITPWFMSLVRLPLDVQDHGGRVGRKRVLAFGNERFDFIGAHDPALGFHEACALFSPMADFRSQAQALETAQAVLDQLRPPPVTPAPAAEPLPARRAFWLGRRVGAMP